MAAHFVALADGSDIAGSIRGPAGWCGLYDLRPTSGVVPSWPKGDPFDGTSVLGPMARTADDLALMFECLRGPVTAPLHDTPYPVDQDSNSLAGLRVAWCMNPGGSATSTEVIQSLDSLRHILDDVGIIVTETEPDLRGCMPRSQF